MRRSGLRGHNVLPASGGLDVAVEREVCGSQRSMRGHRPRRSLPGGDWSSPRSPAARFASIVTRSSSRRSLSLATSIDAASQKRGAGGSSAEATAMRPKGMGLRARSHL